MNYGGLLFTDHPVYAICVTGFRTSSTRCLVPAKRRTTLGAKTTSTTPTTTHATAMVPTSHGLLRSTQQGHIKVRLSLSNLHSHSSLSYLELSWVEGAELLKCRLFLRLSVRLPVCDVDACVRTGWVSSEVIIRVISLQSSLHGTATSAI